MTGVPDVVALIARRDEVLSALQNGPRSKRDLVGATDVSRSTLDRAIRDLEDAGLVTRQNGNVELTLPGSLAYESFRTHADELAGVDDAHDVLAQYPADLDLPPALFRDATVVEPDRHAPHRPVDALTELLADAETVSLYATAIMPEYVETYRNLVLDGTEVDAVITSTVFGELVDEYAADFETVRETGLFTARETDDELPYSIILTDDGENEHVCLMLYSARAVEAFVRNDTPEALAWAKDKFTSLRADATPVVEPD